MEIVRPSCEHCFDYPFLVLNHLNKAGCKQRWRRKSSTIRSCTVESWIIWKRQSPCSIRTTPGHKIVTRLYIREPGWEFLAYPTYSPEESPSDYYLFLSMTNDFSGKNSLLKINCNSFCEGESFLNFCNESWLKLWMFQVTPDRYTKHRALTCLTSARFAYEKI